MRAPINATGLVEVYIAGKKIDKNDPLLGYSFTRDADMEKYLSDYNVTEMFYKLMFNSPQRVMRQIIEVTYYTFNNFCLKCLGTGYVTDFEPAVGGSFKRVSSTDKLAQKSLKWILTSSCSFYPTFTCPLKKFASKKYGIQFMDSDIANAVMTTLNKMKRVQSLQESQQTLDPSEILQNITGVSANESGPSQLNVSFTLQAIGNVSSPVNFTMQGAV